MNTPQHTTQPPEQVAGAGRPASPTAIDVRAMRQGAGQTTEQAARMVHMDARSWRYYEAGERAMHPAMWELYRIKCAQLPDRTQENPTNG